MCYYYYKTVNVPIYAGIAINKNLGTHLGSCQININPNRFRVTCWAPVNIPKTEKQTSQPSKWGHPKTLWMHFIDTDAGNFNTDKFKKKWVQNNSYISQYHTVNVIMVMIQLLAAKHPLLCEVTKITVAPWTVLIKGLQKHAVAYLEAKP